MTANCFESTSDTLLQCERQSNCTYLILNMNTNEELSNQEKEAIVELRKRVEGDMEPEMFNDMYLFLRLLKARDFNIDNAEDMLRKHLEWREKNDIKNILKHKKSEFIEKYNPYQLLGYDKEGNVMIYSDVGNFDVNGFYASAKPEEIIKLSCYEVERDTEELKKQSKKLGRNVDKCIFIFNFGNFTFAQATNKAALSDFILIMKMFMNNYPERLKAAYIINASIYFNIVFAVLKTIFPKRMLNKIYLYTDDAYKEDLLEVVDADMLPAFLGGNRTDPDGNPLCLTFVKHGKPVPKSYYLKKTKKSLAGENDVQTITLSRAAFHEVNVEVKKPGMYLEWEFETKCRDIGFGLFLQELIDDEEKITEIVPIQRIDTEEYPETGTFKCDAAGTYVVVFDNTYSWVRAKQIYYRLKVVTAKEMERGQDT